MFSFYKGYLKKLFILCFTMCIFLFKNYVYKKKTLVEMNSTIENATKKSRIMENLLIDDLLAQEKKSIAEDLSKYPTLKLSSLRRNTYASGGRPKITLLVSSWRSGSSFLGQILASHPVSFYSYEPLHQLGLVKLRDSVNEKANKIYY